MNSALEAAMRYLKHGWLFMVGRDPKFGLGVRLFGWNITKWVLPKNFGVAIELQSHFEMYAPPWCDAYSDHLIFTTFTCLETISTFFKLCHMWVKVNKTFALSNIKVCLESKPLNWSCKVFRRIKPKWALLFSHFLIVSYHNIKLNKGGCFFQTEESWGSRLVRTKTRPSQTTDMDGWMDGHFGPWKYPSHLRAVVKKNRFFLRSGCHDFFKISWHILTYFTIF